jgi:hypothetical protein
MTAYGLRTYGTFRYGAPPATDISAYPFTTQSLDYGSIKLSWVYPLTTSIFTSFIIVRSPIGFPVTADNGDLIYKTTQSALSSGSLLGTVGTLTDIGGFYDPITGSFTTTYSGVTSLGIINSKNVTINAVNNDIKVGQLVTYTPSGLLTGPNAGAGIVGGTTVSAVTVDSANTYVTLSDYATIPVGTTLTFSPTFLTLGKTYYYSIFALSNSAWQRVGTALGTAIKNYKTADTMYDSLPEIYKAALATSSSTSANKNVDLYNFLRVFGVQHDLIKTKVENAKNRYDVSNLDGRLIPALMDQMGFTYESGMGLQQGRRLLKYASSIYLNKGTGAGIKQFVSSFSGYSASLGTSKNLFLTLDCSSFEAGDGFWGNTGSYSIISKTTAAAEGGSPSPVQVTSSPNGYPNSQSGYLKMTSLANSGGPYVSYEFSYGISQDTVNISTSTVSPATNYSYVTLTTDTEHSFRPGQSVVISNMNPPYLNGVQKITATPDSRTFTIYSSAMTGSQPIRPYGSAVIASGSTITGGATTVSITTSLLHYIVPGQSVTISGVLPLYFAGTTLPINSTYVAAAGTTGTTLVLTTGTLTSNTTTTAEGSTFVSPATVNLYDVKNCGIPVTAGSSYYFSIYSQAKTTLRAITTGIKWYDQYGTYLSSATTGTNNNAVGSWTRISSSFPSTAPASAFYASPYVSYTAASFGDVHYFDCAQFEKVPGSLTTTYADSRRVDIYLNAPRINGVINAGFEAGTTGWSVPTGGSLSLDTSNVYPTSAVGLGTAISTQSAKITASGSTTALSTAPVVSSYYIDVTAGNPYSVSAYVKGSHTDSVTIGVSWYAGSTFISTTTSASTTLSTSAFTRISWTPVSSSATQMIAPATATKAVITLTFSGANTHIYYVDSVLFESSYTVNNYFDGGTGYNVLDDLVWEQNAAGTRGTSGTGRSLYYPNKQLVQSRLNTVLSDYMPIGSNYALFIGTTAT